MRPRTDDKKAEKRTHQTREPFHDWKIQEVYVESSKVCRDSCFLPCLSRCLVGRLFIPRGYGETARSVGHLDVDRGPRRQCLTSLESPSDGPGIDCPGVVLCVVLWDVEFRVCLTSRYIVGYKGCLYLLVSVKSADASVSEDS